MENLIDKVKKSDSFQVPDGYFDALPDQVMQRIEVEEKVAQAMEEYRDGHSFVVPDGYFAALPDKVMARIGAAEKRQFLFRRRLITAISVAASLVLVVGIGLLWNSFQNNGSNEDTMTAAVESPAPAPATSELTLPENALAQVTPSEQSVSTPQVGRKPTPTQTDIIEQKADDFVEKYSDEDLDVIDYEILDYFSEEDYITFFLES